VICNITGYISNESYVQSYVFTDTINFEVVDAFDPYSEVLIDDQLVSLDFVNEYALDYNYSTAKQYTLKTIDSLGNQYGIGSLYSTVSVGYALDNSYSNKITIVGGNKINIATGLANSSTYVVELTITLSKVGMQTLKIIVPLLFAVQSIFPSLRIDNPGEFIEEGGNILAVPSELTTVPFTRYTKKLLLIRTIDDMPVPYVDALATTA
jgi:hypothetical protein